MQEKEITAAAAALICTPEEFGGSADSGQVSTGAIQQAIDHCAAAGGGEVRLSKGLWLSGPLKLKSHVCLNITAGATLKADNSEGLFKEAYIGRPAADGEAFILADGAEHVTITGAGTIDGSGAELWWEEAENLRKAIRSGNTADFEKRFPGVKLANGMPRPWLIELNNVEQAAVHGVRLQNSPMWNLVLRSCRQVLIDQVYVDAPEDSPNTDGIDIVSSQQVKITGVTIHTGDDNIAVKSGVEQDGAAPSSDIVIEGCTMYAGHGISVGSETANGIGEVVVRDTCCKRGMNGIRIKSARDRGNKIGPLVVENVTMEGVETPLLITLSYAGNSGAAGLGLIEPIEAEPVTTTTPYVKGVYVSNLTATGADIAALISGLPESPILDVQLKNVHIDSRLGIQARYAAGTIRQSEIKVQEGAAVARGPQTSLTEES